MLISGILLALVSCVGPSCPPHIDADEDGICENCHEKIEADPKPDSPVEPEKPDLSAITFDDKSVIYDGKEHSISVEGALPDGVTVDYVGGGAVNVGSYNVIAKFYFNGAELSENRLTATLTINKATYDMSGVHLLSTTKTYDGNEVVPTISGELPEGVTREAFIIKNSLGENVEKMVDVGVYTVFATFASSNTNYYPIDPISATVKIDAASIGGISFSDKVFQFDGKEKSIFVTGAPDWMEVTYSGNGVVAPGTYTVTATFGEYENYLPIDPMTAEIIISVDTSVSTSGIIFEEYQDGYAVSGIETGTSVVVIPETYNNKPVLSVKSFAFDGNKELLYVYIPSSVVNIGNKAFSDCTSLLKVDFGNIKVIGQQAFKNTAIKEISLPESLESIGFGAFEGTELESITLPFVGGSRHSSNAFIGFLFGGSTYAANATKVPATLTKVVLSNGCVTIPSRAFYGVSSLAEVVLGRSVIEIGNGAFQGCASLNSIYIPNSVTAIPADAKAENSPFYGTASDMLLVIESVKSMTKWGKYFANITDANSAIIVYGKTYEDYVINKDSFRTINPDDATLAALFANNELLPGFAPNVYEYTLENDVNVPLPELFCVSNVSGASVSVIPASASNANTATVTVVSANGEKTLVYKVKFNLTGTFNVTAEVVNKDGAKGTVTFVVDDGYTPTATFMKSMMEKYPELAVTYAVYTKNFLTTSPDYKTDNGLIIDDIDNDGIMEYVLDDNGKYTYIRNEDVIEFWNDILSVGRSEIVAHSHTHAFWGVNDEGGAQLTAGTNDAISTRIYSTLAEGSATKEIYASMQIIKELFGDTSKGITYVNAGIPPKEGDTAVTEEVRVYLSKQTVRVLNDTKVRVADGKVYLEELTWVNLQSTVGTLPANTDVVTTADTSSGILPAGTPIYLASDYVTVPTVDNNGNPNVVKGFKEYIKELYAQALADGTFIGARTSGQVVYTPDDFLDDENRLYRKAYIIATSTNDPAMPDSWKKHIDNAIAKNGGWASFCIHAMTEDVSEDGQGKHKISWEQADALFGYACSKGDDLWIATQTDATMYYHQWSTFTVTASYNAENETISVSLTDKENDEVYDMPLTVRVNVPSNWASATVNGETLSIRIDDDGKCFVLVDVAPETTVSIIGV